MLSGIYNYTYDYYEYFFGPNYEKMLLNAANTGNIQQVNLAISKGANINYREINTLDTPLHKAAAQGHTSIVKLLLTKEGILVNEVNKHKETPLHKAALIGHTDTILLLISKGAKINAMTNDKISSLDMLIIHEKIEPLKQLIKHSKSTDSAQYNNLIAIMIKHNKLDMALNFIENVPNNIKIDPNVLLEFAVKHSTDIVVTTLLEKFPNIDDTQLNKLLNMAVNKNNITLTKLFLSKGACANNESTPLLYAAKNGYTEILHALIQAGAKLNVHDIKGDNVLQIAIKHLHFNIFKILINNNTLNVSETNFDSESANQIISNSLDVLRKSLKTLDEEFQNKLQTQVQQFNSKKRQLFVGEVNNLNKTLRKKQEKIFSQIEKLVAMQALLNNVETFKASFDKQMSPLTMVPPKPEPKSNEFFEIEDLNIQTSPSIPTTYTINNDPQRIVGEKSLRLETSQDDKASKVSKKVKI